MDHDRYARVETLISVLINSVLSGVFTFLTLGGRDPVAVWSPGGVAFDFVPQTFMISLMSVLVPTFLTRRRIAAGRLSAANAGAIPMPRHIALRSAVVAVISTLIFASAAIAVLWLAGVDTISLALLYPLKIAYGALVAVIVTPIALRAALGDPQRERT